MDVLNRWLMMWIEGLPKGWVKPFAMRYIAGETLEDAVRVVKALNAKETLGTIDILGENVSTREESLSAVNACEQVLHAIQAHRLGCTLSIKLSHLGLRIDEAICYSNVRRLLEVARSYGNFIRIDMEESTVTSPTLALYERLRNEGFENVGIVIQAYLRRSDEDLRRLIPMKVNVRLCKGAYAEPEVLAFKGREEIRRSFLSLLRKLLDGQCYVGIATHDEPLIQEACRLVRELPLRRQDYEFQMLYGVRVKRREELVAQGHRLRIYVPFGEQWHAYSMRRFKENPRLFRHVLGSLFSSRG